MTRRPVCAGCPSCVAADRRDLNYDRARATTIAALCVDCAAPVNTTVGMVMASRGRVHCERHGGRKVVRR